MNIKTIVANELTRFFRFFKISIPIGIASFLIIFLFVFEGYKTFNTDFSYSKYQNGIIYYGDSFNKKAWIFSNGDFYSINFRTTEEFKTELKKAIQYYQKEKIKISLLYGLIVFFGIPILLILGRLTSNLIKGSIKWIDKNKTI